jgi:hypothetical protein
MNEFTEGFRVDLLYPDEYSDFIAEIYFDNKFICLISQESGPESLEISFNKYPLQGELSVPLNGFKEALVRGVKRLYELRKTSKTPP